MKVYVLGGGASGMVSAIISRRCGNDVTIIEKNSGLGKKLILTGNGRCNYFNEDMSLSNFYSDGDLERFINNKNLDKVKSFFDSIGLYPYIKDGYYYPYSNTSYAVYNALLKEIKVLGINIIEEEVKDIQNGYVITSTNKYKYDKVIVSLGGASLPKTGSDGFGFELLKRLGHTIIPVRPALVPLLIEGNFKDWKGIRVRGSVSLEGHTDSGEIQLIENGISGICVMNISRFAKIGSILHINFTNIDSIYDFISSRDIRLKNRTIIELLESIVNYKLLYFLFQKEHIKDISWSSMDEKTKLKVCKILTDYEVKVMDTKGFLYAETIRGGVILDELNDNLESKIIPNLFITGELIDIDGKCGGYNLTNAWITGILAGEEND